MPKNNEDTTLNEELRLTVPGGFEIGTGPLFELGDELSGVATATPGRALAGGLVLTSVTSTVLPFTLTALSGSVELLATSVTKSTTTCSEEGSLV